MASHLVWIISLGMEIQNRLIKVRELYLAVKCTLESGFDGGLLSMLCVGCINLSFAYVEGESLLMGLKDIALSSGRCVIPTSVA